VADFLFAFGRKLAARQTSDASANAPQLMAVPDDAFVTPVENAITSRHWPESAFVPGEHLRRSIASRWLSSDHVSQNIATTTAIRA
jgi:hypothetical protein